MRHPAKQIPIKAIRISLDDIRRVYDRLKIQVDAEAERILAKFVKPDDKRESDFVAEKADLKSRAFRITVTVGGRDGSSLFGDDTEIFSSPNLPDQIAYVYMTNVVAFELVANEKPVNRFSLNLDFSEPPLLDANNFVSGPTPNNSNLQVDGDNDAWVSAVHEAVDGIIRNRRTGRRLIHKAFAYDFGMFVIALPFAFWLCSKLSGPIEAWFGSLHSVISAGAYVYTFFVVLFAYRVLFGYTKWAFPTVEITNNVDHSSRHRFFLECYYSWATGQRGLGADKGRNYPPPCQRGKSLNP